jgi:DNA-binding MltR family transcriptional regulator
MEKLDNRGIKLFVFGYTVRTLVVRIFRYLFVCLRYAVPVLMHYRLCFLTVRMKLLQNGKLVRLS